MTWIVVLAAYVELAIWAGRLKSALVGASALLCILSLNLLAESSVRRVEVVPSTGQYHLASAGHCWALRYVSEQDIERTTEDDAKSRGFTPCDRCVCTKQ